MDVPQYPPTGFPSPAEEWVEPSLNVHDLLIVHPTTTFFMHVNGDAMVGAGIHAGDIVVVDRALEPADQRVIVAILGETCTIKRLEMLPDSLALHSAHPAYRPIDVTNRLDFHVWGIVTCVIHPLLPALQERFRGQGS
jgi:DNA polymerase V